MGHVGRSGSEGVVLVAGGLIAGTVLTPLSRRSETRALAVVPGRALATRWWWCKWPCRWCSWLARDFSRAALLRWTADRFRSAPRCLVVVRATRYRHAAEPLRPFAYTNFWQTPSIDRRPIDSRTQVRVAGDVRVMLPLIRRAIAAIDPTVPIIEDRPLTEWLDHSFLAVRAAGVMLGCFSALALFLSAIGLYGVVAATASQRRREIAIRMALGAERDDVARLVVGHGAMLAALGTASGLPAAWASARWIASLLYGVDAYDPATTAETALVLIGVALLASYLPARRALRVDPMVALRYE
jgi:putative ABC transport system permease protein